VPKWLHAADFLNVG